MTALGWQAEAMIADDARAAGRRGDVGAAAERADLLLDRCSQMLRHLRDRDGEVHPDALAWSAVGEAWAAQARGEPDPTARRAAVEATDNAEMVLLATEALTWPSAAAIALPWGTLRPQTELGGPTMSAATSS